MSNKYYKTLSLIIIGGLIGLFLFFYWSYQNIKLGASIPTAVAKFSTTLTTEISSTATSFTLTSGTTADGTTLDGFYGFVIDSGTSSEEFVTAACVDTACTGVTRGISVITGNTTISALKKSHKKGASVKISDAPILLVMSRIMNGDESFPNALSFDGILTYTSESLAPVLATHLTDKGYVDEQVVAGAPVASTTVKGIVEEATDAELQAGTAAGGTGARLFAGGASHTQTPTANKVPVALSTGLFADGWLGLTTAGDMCYSDGSILQRLALGTQNYFLMAGASAPEWGGANLNEANTFFGATNISGAEAETLTDGSNADSLHTHTYSERLTTFTTDVDVVDTNETTIMSVSIPGGTLSTTNGVRGRIYMDDFDNGTTGTVTVKLKYGNTTIATANTASTGVVENNRGHIDFLLLSAGGTTSQEGSVEMFIYSGPSVPYTYATGTASENSANTLTLTITVTFSVDNNLLGSFAHGYAEIIK